MESREQPLVSIESKYIFMKENVFQNVVYKIAAILRRSQYINPFPSDVIWRHKSGWTLAKVMASRLMPPNHKLNQCRRIVIELLWYLPYEISQEIHIISKDDLILKIIGG